MIHCCLLRWESAICGQRVGHKCGETWRGLHKANWRVHRWRFTASILQSGKIFSLSGNTYQRVCDMLFWWFPDTKIQTDRKQMPATVIQYHKYYSHLKRFGGKNIEIQDIIWLSRIWCIEFVPVRQLILQGARGRHVAAHHKTLHSLREHRSWPAPTYIYPRSGYGCQ